MDSTHVCQNDRGRSKKADRLSIRKPFPFLFSLFSCFSSPHPPASLPASPLLHGAAPVSSHTPTHHHHALGMMIVVNRTCSMQPLSRQQEEEFSNNKNNDLLLPCRSQQPAVSVSIVGGSMQLQEQQACILHLRFHISAHIYDWTPLLRDRWLHELELPS